MSASPGLRKLLLDSTGHDISQWKVRGYISEKAYMDAIHQEGILKRPAGPGRLSLSETCVPLERVQGRMPTFDLTSNFIPLEDDTPTIPEKRSTRSHEYVSIPDVKISTLNALDNRKPRVGAHLHMQREAMPTNAQSPRPVIDSFVTPSTNDESTVKDAIFGYRPSHPRQLSPPIIVTHNDESLSDHEGHEYQQHELASSASPLTDDGVELSTKVTKPVGVLDHLQNDKQASILVDCIGKTDIKRKEIITSVSHVEKKIRNLQQTITKRWNAAFPNTTILNSRYDDAMPAVRSQESLLPLLDWAFDLPAFFDHFLDEEVPVLHELCDKINNDESGEKIARVSRHIRARVTYLHQRVKRVDRICKKGFLARNDSGSAPSVPLDQSSWSTCGTNTVAQEAESEDALPPIGLIERNEYLSDLSQRALHSQMGESSHKRKLDSDTEGTSETRSTKSRRLGLEFELPTPQTSISPANMSPQGIVTANKSAFDTPNNRLKKRLQTPSDQAFLAMLYNRHQVQQAQEGGQMSGQARSAVWYAKQIGFEAMIAEMDAQIERMMDVSPQKQDPRW